MLVLLLAWNSKIFAARGLYVCTCCNKQSHLEKFIVQSSLKMPPILLNFLFQHHWPLCLSNSSKAIVQCFSVVVKSINLWARIKREKMVKETGMLDESVANWLHLKKHEGETSEQKISANRESNMMILIICLWFILKTFLTVTQSLSCRRVTWNIKETVIVAISAPWEMNAWLNMCPLFHLS